MSGDDLEERATTDPVDLDEDLFDFPAENPFAAEPQPGGAGLGSAASSGADDADDLDLTRALEDDYAGFDEYAEQLDEQLATDTGADAPPARPAPAASAPRRAGLPPGADPDEDLFDFPAVDDPFTSHPFEDDDLGLGPDDMLIDAHVDPEVRSIVEDAAAAGDDAELEPREAEPAGTVGPALPSRAARRAPREPVEHVVAAPAAAPRAVLVLVGLSLVANLALLGFTWRTGSSIREGLGDVGEAIARTFQEVRIQAAAPPVEPPEPRPPVEPVDLAPATIETPERVQLRVAEEELAAGEPTAARRRLYRLLATIDAVTGPERDDLEAQATFLVARTYRQQARALEEAEK